MRRDEYEIKSNNTNTIRAFSLRINADHRVIVKKSQADVLFSKDSLNHGGGDPDVNKFSLYNHLRRL